MEPARKLDQPRASSSPSSAPPQSPQPERLIGESGREIQPWEIKLGKIIFYLTIVSGLWFFYWLNGIQCPC
jgi:hypothetical protein